MASKAAEAKLSPATRSARALSPAPRAREMMEAEPIPTVWMNICMGKQTASVPGLWPMKMVSTRLYREFTIMPSMAGPESRTSSRPTGMVPSSSVLLRTSRGLIAAGSPAPGPPL